MGYREDHVALEQPRPAGGGEPSHELADERGQRLPLLGQRFIAGRSEQCDIRLADELASRRHFLLEQTPAGWQITDLNSTNGTALNGRRLPPGAPVPVALSDRISVGHTTFVMQQSVRGPEPSAAAGRPPVAHLMPPSAGPVQRGEHSALGRRPSAIPVWQWIVSAFLFGATLMIAFGAFQPWVRIQVRLSFEGIAGGELLSGALSMANGVLQKFFEKPPLVTANAVEISGMSSYGWLTLLAACVAALMAALDLALRLKRSALPGIVYVVVALLPGIVMAADFRRFLRLGAVPILFGINLLDIFQGATKILEPKVVPLTGLYLTAIGLALLLVAGVLRAILPALSAGRHPSRQHHGTS